MSTEPKRLTELERTADRVFRGQTRIAHRFERAYAGKLLYVNGIGWHAWDGKRWGESLKGEPTQALLQLMRDTWEEAFSDPSLQQDLRACQSSGGMNGVLTISSQLPSFAYIPQDMDSDPYLLNVANGTFDLRTSSLKPHDPSDRITKITRAAYDWNAPAPMWDSVLDRILPDPELRGFLQRYVGTALVGRVLEHALVILVGPGGNGKSTFYEAISNALGEYAISAEPELFMARDGAHPTGQMDLFGRRWVVTSETEQGRRLASATVKRLTGGDKIRARRMYKDFVEFDPSHSAVLVTNHLPKITGNDPALWRRIHVVPFKVVIPKDQQLGTLDEALHAEADGILSWALAGWLDYTQKGYKLADPSSVLEATGEYRSESDDLERFIEECCVVGQGLRVLKGSLQTQWELWRLGEDGVPRLSRPAFKREMDAKGFPSSRGTGNVAYFEGLDLASR